MLCSRVVLRATSEIATSMSLRNIIATFSLAFSVSDSVDIRLVLRFGSHAAIYTRLNGRCEYGKLSHPTKNSFRKSVVSCGSD
jgi:hypothetical protein